MGEGWSTTEDTTEDMRTRKGASAITGGTDLRRGATGDTDLSQDDHASKALDRFGGQEGKTPASPMLTVPNPATEEKATLAKTKQSSYITTD